MTHVIPCPIGNVTLFPGTLCPSRRRNQFRKFIISSQSSRQKTSLNMLLFNQSTFTRSYTTYNNVISLKDGSRIEATTTSSMDVAIEESNSSVAVGISDQNRESSSKSVQIKRSRPTRKSERPPVKNEELIPGATFTGKVRSIQPFGAFVDFGAFTDGLVHVSRMSESFVKDVSSMVSVGQEVKVRLVEVNTENGRISLSMRDTDDVNKLQSKKDVSNGNPNNEKPRQSSRKNFKSTQKRDVVQKTSKFAVGQILDGTVKNLTRSGAFVSLPENEEGFLPVSEEADGFASIMGNSELQIGQEVKVRVLRISRGRVTLTMKQEENVEELNMKLNQGVVHIATNPFVLAFRRNKDIATFLDDREMAQKQIENTKQIELNHKEGESDDSVVEDTAKVKNEIEEDTVTKVDEVVKTEPESKVIVEETTAQESDSIVDPSEILIKEEDPEDTINVVNLFPNSASKSIASEDVINEEDPKITSDSLENVDNENGMIPEEPEPSAISTADEYIEKEEPEENSNEPGIPRGANNELPSLENLVAEENEMGQGLVASVKEEIVLASMTSSEVEKPDPTATENASSVQNEIPLAIENTAKATVSPSLVKKLREETGAGMMDCKRALAETGGDLVKAHEYLRKKGLASADKKASRVTAEGRVGSYIHDSRIGVLIEVNCETDFVSRGEIFKQLVDDLAMQVAACPQVQYLVTEDVPEEFVSKEREIEIQKEDLLTKPEQIRIKIVEGRIKKRLEELALLEQSFIKDDKIVVKDWVKQTIATIGENIKVTRFVRFNLGEGLQKKSQDFAAEVAAQTAARPPSSVSTHKPRLQDNETVEKAPSVTVSASLVKQLREETGAGMMDCKKALTETGGDLEKAQEYLRKKGLLAADKKSSRLAAEGRIASYIHDARIGVLIEINCETDFVGRSDRFKELADDLAMQVAACPLIQYVAVDDIPENISNKEKELEMQREDLQTKPVNIREKIVEGRVAKKLGELALMEQPFIKDDSVLVKDLVKQCVATLGENIKVRRFVRFTLGETNENEKSGES